jgi:hypothetical protein
MEVEYLANKRNLNFTELFDMHVFTVRGNFAAVMMIYGMLPKSLIAHTRPGLVKM